MNSTLKISFVLLTFAVSLTAQDRFVRGKVTYVAGDAIYVSLGKESGVKDSTSAYIIANKDTIAVLKIFATSSKSAACTIVRSKRQPVIGDVVIAGVTSVDTSSPRQTVPTVRNDTLSTRNIAQTDTIEKAKSASLISLQGRISLQYATTRQSNSAPDVSQPGVLINVRGKMNELPIRFEFYGNFRSTVYATTSQLAGSNSNQTHIYRMSLDYDDGLNRVSIGRTIPPLSAAVGYIDGAVISRSVGEFTFGAGGGFEPTFSQRSFSTDFKKLVLFGNYHSDSRLPTLGSVAYSRTYFHSLIDREVVSALLNIDPSSELHLWAQSDFDLRLMRNNQLVLKPNLTNLFAMANYRIANFLALGAGISSWRPTYSYSSINTLADSLFDRSLRTNPTVSLSLYLPGNVSFFNSYTPRSSDAGYGKEYSNTSSASISNVFASGISLRGTMNVNTGAATTTRGYGASVQKTFWDLGDVSLRYQYYRYEIIQSEQPNTSKSIGIDIMMSALRDFTLWGSIERFLGLGANATNTFVELSWRF